MYFLHKNIVQCSGIKNQPHFKPVFFLLMPTDICYRDHHQSKGLINETIDHFVTLNGCGKNMFLYLAE